MMAPTAVLEPGGDLRLVVGSAGSNRIRSAILQVIVGVLDHGLDAGEAVRAPRVHAEGGAVYAEPGVPLELLDGGARELVRFREPNLFFGGAQAVERDPATGALRAAGDPAAAGPWRRPDRPSSPDRAARRRPRAPDPRSRARAARSTPARPARSKGSR